MTTRMLLFLLLSFPAALIGSAQTKAEKKIRQVMAEQELAWNRGDINAFMGGYHQDDSLTFIGKSGVTYGWENTLSNYKKGYPDTASMGKLHFRLLRIQKLSPKYYHVIGHWHLSRTKGNLEGHFNLLFRNIKGKWLIVADHSS